MSSVSGRLYESEEVPFEDRATLNPGDAVRLVSCGETCWARVMREETGRYRGVVTERCYNTQGHGYHKDSEVEFDCRHIFAIFKQQG